MIGASLGEAVGRVISEQIGQIVDRCRAMRTDLERQIGAQGAEIAELRSQLAFVRERLAVLESGGKRGFLLGEAGDFPMTRRPQ